jgi:CRP-like cAMP-binding protein
MVRFRDEAVDPLDIPELYAALAEQPALSPRRQAELRPRLFDGLTEAQVEAMVHAQTRVTFYAGDVVYEVGETEKGMGVILSGQLEIHLGCAPHTQRVATLSPGDLFGEGAALLDGRRDARVVASQESTVLLLPEDFIEHLAVKDAQTCILLGRNLSRTLAARLRHANRLIEQLHADH